MKTVITTSILTICLMAVSAQAALYEYTPSGASDLTTMPATNFFKWGMAKQWGAGETVVSATLTFTSLAPGGAAGAAPNFEGPTGADVNDLWIHQLDNNTATTTVTSGVDNPAPPVNQYNGKGAFLVSYHNLPPVPADQIHVFSPGDLTNLVTFADNNGHFALGLDPDADFSNLGVKLSVVTRDEEGQIPEPATMGLMLIGGVAMIARRRRRT